MTQRHRHSPAPFLRRAILVVLLAPLLAGCAPGDEDDGGEDASLLPMTIVEWLFPPDADYADADPLGTAQISWDPMAPGENTITVTLTDLHGAPLPLIASTSEMDIVATRLAPDAEPVALAPERDDATWTAEDATLDETGWYQLDIRLLDDAGPVAETRTWALLPDPSVHGPEAVDLPASDPDAEALYQGALADYGRWERARWRESLSSGAGAVVVSEFAVTERPAGETAMLMDSRYVASFRPGADGTVPPPRLDFATRVTIGERQWARDAEGEWTQRDALPPATFEERAETYAGATNVLPGGTATVNGAETTIVTFYLPPSGGQSEAWFAWWIDAETGRLVRAVMIARMHFMVWDFAGIDTPVEIEPPAPHLVATPSSGSP